MIPTPPPFQQAVYTAAGAGLVCAAALGLLLKTGLAWRLATDLPNDRSLHQRPTPRVGGWGIVPAVVVAILAAAPTLWPVATCTLLLAAVSQIDDRRGLSARVRFAAHLAAVAAIIASYPGHSPGWWSVLFVVPMVWVVNLYNFMDGADGLAGGMALFGFTAYAAAALYGEHPAQPLALASAAVAGAAIGFLIFNLPPARLFMGDAGSIPTGFLAAALGYGGWQQDVWPVWFPPLVFAPFVYDASVTLMRRLARGEKFWQAHREHHYQRMVRSGIGHRRTTLSWYVVMFVGIIISLWGLKLPTAVQWTLAAAWLAVLALAGLAIDRHWQQFQSTVHKQAEPDADAS